MYTPKAFAVDDPEVLHAQMRGISLATLVTMTSSGLRATHLPLLLDEGAGPFGRLLGHVSRANAQWRESVSDVDALAIFTGPDAYVSPSWYPAKKQGGRVVPTWNYAAIHAYGPIAFFEDPERLRSLVTRLTEKHEQGRPAPWRVSDAPAEYVEAQLKAIVGFSLPIRRLEGKHKLNQNRSLEDMQGVVEGLRALGGEKNLETARLMEQAAVARRAKEQ